MKKTENTKATTNTTTENGNIKIVGKRIEFVINNDENNEKTEKATVAFIEWLKTSFNSKKYIDRYGIIPGGWCIDITDVNEIIHVGTAFDSITGGMVDILYLKFDNRLLNRIVYLDNTIVERGSILLPINEKIEYVPFALKYTTARKKSTTTKTNSTKTPTKTQTKTTEKTTEKTDKTTPTKTKTPKTATKTTKTTEKTKSTTTPTTLTKTPKTDKTTRTAEKANK